MFELRVLGPLRVERGGVPISVGSFAQQRLLVRLALAHRSGTRAEVLSEDLGVNVPALRTAVWRLRKTLGGVVTTKRSGYALVGVESDHERFEREVQAASKVGVADRIAVLGQSLDYWRGSAFEGFADELWVQPLAVRLEELRDQARESRAEGMLHLGRYVQAIAELQALTLDQPLRDRPHGLLMQALAGAGRRTEALRVFQDYRRFLIDEIGTEPGGDLRRIDADIASGLDDVVVLGTDRGQEPSISPAGRSAGRLPQPSTTFVGRGVDRDAITLDLKDSQIVTLTGVGGVGKTRLAVEVGHDLQLEWAGGVRFADLTRAGRGDDVVPVVREALGLSSASCASAEELVRVIEADELLLVLDNCEHVLDDVAALVELIEWSCSGVTVLATSREGLGVSGERIYALAPLSASIDAVELFADRASAVDRSFRLDDETRPVVEELCQSLDGIPLAVELAAARVRSLSVQDVAARLRKDFRRLSGVRRTAVSRHRSLAAVLDWSFDLLSHAEQRALLSLAAFVQAFSLSDAEGLLGDSGSAETIAALVDKSMLDRYGDGTTYRLLQTIRYYCIDRLGDGELDDARADHAAYILGETRVAVADVNGANSIRGGQRVRALFPELRAAARWAAETDRLDLALDFCFAVDSVFVLDIDVGALAADVDCHPDSRRHPRSLLLEGFVLHDNHLKGAPSPVDKVRRLVDRFCAGESSSIVAAFGPMTLSYRGHHAEAIAAAERVRTQCLTYPDSPARRYSLQATCYLTGKPEYLTELRQGLAAAQEQGSDYWIGTIGMSVAHVMADIDPAEAREIVLSCVGSALDLEMPLLVQTSLVLYVVLVAPEDEPSVLEPRISSVLARELAQARRGYRLRAHHFLVLAALLSVACEYDLAAKSLAAHDALGTRSSARSQAMIDAVRASIDARLADAGAQPAPTPPQGDLSALAAQIEEALSSRTGRV